MKVISIDRSKSREEKLLDREIQILSDMKKFKHENIVQYVEFFRLSILRTMTIVKDKGPKHIENDDYG
jgi:hypothetical protein